LEVTYKLNFNKKRIEIIDIDTLRLEVRKPLFISYNHLDKKWLTQLRKWLKPLEQLDLIRIWSDQEIKGGTEWQKEIKKALSSAKVALLLISQDFLNSDFINNNELPQLLKKAKDEGLIILWIAVEESTVELSHINQFQAIHKEPPLCQLRKNARDKELKHIFYKIKEVVEQ
jgi:internalin A